MAYAPVAGMALWLKADAGVLDASGNPCTNGVACKTWQDQSGNANHLIDAGTSGNRPTYDGSAVALLYGDTLAQYLTTAISTLRTAFVVMQNDAITTNLQFFFGCLAGLFDWHANFDGTSKLLDASGNASAAITGGSGFQNGASTSPTSMTRTSAYSLYEFVTTGNVHLYGLSFDRSVRRGWQGRIKEVLVYTSALSTGDRQTTETYLNDKYHLYLPYPPRGGLLVHPGMTGGMKELAGGIAA